MNKCKRCGKTNVDVHTCTPPREIEIARIMNTLTDYRSNHQDLRFGQLITNIGYLKDGGLGLVQDPYEYRDKELLELLTVIGK